MNDYHVYGGGLSSHLQRQGYPLKRTEPSEKNKDKDVYVFERTEDLLEAVDAYELNKRNSVPKPATNSSTIAIVNQLKNLEWCMNENTRLVLEVLEAIDKKLNKTSKGRVKK